MVPLQRFVVENCRCDDGEDCQRNCFLDDLELHQAEGAAVDAASNAVCWNHEEVLDERNAPRRKDHKD